MADFMNAIMTDGGAALLAKTTAGAARIKFTKLVTGSGDYAESEKTRENLQGCVKLKVPMQEIPFSSVAMETNTCVKLVALISNKELTSGYYVNEVGIFAIDEMDENAEPILYSIAVANVADYLPPYNGLVASTITQEYFATVDNALEVTIQANAGAVALAEDLETLKKEVQTDLEEMGEKLSGIEEGANKTVIDKELSPESTNPVQNAAVAAALKEFTEEINKIKEMLPSLASPTAADAGKILKIDADGNAVWAEGYGSSLQAKYPDFYAQDYDVDITDRKHIETVYEDGHRAVVDIADDGDITQTLYDADGVAIAQRQTTFNDDKNHISERKVDVNELGQSDMDS